MAPRPALTPQGVESALKASGFPVSDVQVLTAESDPNKLLGRPGQYVAKVNWKDGRAPDDEGKIELFTDKASMDKWVTYTDAIAKSSPLMFEYVVADEKRFAVMRLPKGLTPDQVKQYQEWLAKL